MLGGPLANPAGLASDSPHMLNIMYFFYPGNTHQNIVGAGSLQKEEGGDEIIG